MTNLLILEDNEALAKMQKMLAEKRFKMNVQWFTKPSDAIATNAVDWADLIISDYEMEENETALDLLHYTTDHQIHTPVIMCTGYEHARNEIKAANVGQDIAGFVNKAESISEWLPLYLAQGY